MAEENGTLFSEKYCKSSLTSVGAALKRVQEIKSFLLENDAAHLLKSFNEIENGLCEMSTGTFGELSIRDFFKPSD